MKTALIATALFAAVAFTPVAQADGCLKGAAVAGLGGHVARHHGLLGAAAGCAVGHHMANKKDERAAQAQKTVPVNTAGAGAVATIAGPSRISPANKD